MDENNEISSLDSGAVAELKIPESPKPLAFTVDFGDGKTIDTQRHKTLVEKFQKKHRRGQSLSKIDENNLNINRNKPLTGNLPRKSSFQSEGYFSSDEKSERARTKQKRPDLSLPLKNVLTDKMSQSFPNSTNLFNMDSTPNQADIELKDISSPELDLISPFSPRDNKIHQNDSPADKLLLQQQQSSPIINNCSKEIISNNNISLNKSDEFIDGTEFDFDKSDTVSDAGTYTLDADKYSEEQKARMSIDTEFNIEQVSVMKKTEDYIKSLYAYTEETTTETVTKNVEEIKITESNDSPKPTAKFHQNHHRPSFGGAKMLSPILSPTQNLSITEPKPTSGDNNINDSLNQTYTKIMFPSSKAKGNGLEQLIDQGSVISVTSSGVFRTKNDKDKMSKKLSLTQSEIHVEAYVGDKVETDIQKNRKLTANIINVQSISVKHNNESNGISDVLCSNLNLGKISMLPPPIGGVSGKMSPTKIPSPIHTSRPRSRSSVSSLNVDLSDSSLETESYLKPTQNCINSLQKKLSLEDSDDPEYEESDFDLDNKYHVQQLNNTAHNLLKQKATHIRHNSLDDKISNKLEHFQSKNLQGIDQTSLFNQYNQKVIHKIQNSPNNSPIRRSSSFSTKNLPLKNTNLSIPQKESNIKNSPNLSRNSSIQRSASTANIKPAYLLLRRSSNSDSNHQKIDRNQYGDTESSSEEDFEKNLSKKKDLSTLTNTRYNRAFSLRRGRLDDSTSTTTTPAAKCPNTPEMRRKFQPDVRAERAISVDRKPIKTNEVQSRYLLNITKKTTTPTTLSSNKCESTPTTTTTTTKIVPKVGGGSGKVIVANAASTTKPQVFSRTDSGRFSTRTGKPPTSGGQKGPKKDQGKKSSGRSNSSLSSREKEFQNWKRRKSYDPMKAAAEGKRKELAKRQNMMTQSYTEANNQNQDCDSSPSHSSSVHRSQSFHGTAALEQLISSEEEEDLTLSADEGFSPPTPSPCELSPARASLRNAWKDHILH